MDNTFWKVTRGFAVHLETSFRLISLFNKAIANHGYFLLIHCFLHTILLKKKLSWEPIFYSLKNSSGLYVSFYCLSMNILNNWKCPAELQKEIILLESWCQCHTESSSYSSVLSSMKARWPAHLSLKGCRSLL